MNDSDSDNLEIEVKKKTKNTPKKEKKQRKPRAKKAPILKEEIKTIKNNDEDEKAIIDKIYAKLTPELQRMTSFIDQYVEKKKKKAPIKKVDEPLQGLGPSNPLLNEFMDKYGKKE